MDINQRQLDNGFVDKQLKAKREDFCETLAKVEMIDNCIIGIEDIKCRH